MSCCEFESNGDASAPDEGGGGAFSEDAETTDGSAQQTVLAQLPVDGAGVKIELDVWAQQVGPLAADAGDRAGWFHCFILASRNSVGINFLFGVTIGPTGYTNVATLPWTAVAVPAGWNLIGVAVVGSSIVLNYNAAAGQTVEWRLRASRSFTGGATP